MATTTKQAPKQVPEQAVTPTSLRKAYDGFLKATGALEQAASAVRAPAQASKLSAYLELSAESTVEAVEQALPRLLAAIEGARRAAEQLHAVASQSPSDWNIHSSTGAQLNPQRLVNIARGSALRSEATENARIVRADRASLN